VTAPPARALATDLYQLAMLETYFESGMRDVAVFDLFARRLPRTRSYLVACGLDAALAYLETLRFAPEDLAWLESLGRFRKPLLDALADLRFTGTVRAVPEGTAVFAGEPILEVIAPLPEAQLVETALLNRIHVETLIASKAARVVEAAQGRSVVDFGLRRAHGEDAGLAAARAAFVAGVDATSNVLAGRLFGIPVAGTMAHSFVLAHHEELDAFRSFAASHPGTTLLVDTYDAEAGVRSVVALARELGPRFDVRAVRIDSGDLAAHARTARRVLDEAGLRDVRIFASSSLDEHAIRDLLCAGAPIDGFGVGTRMVVSDDAPALDLAYKLVEYDGRGRRKLSPDKSNLPGRKQIFRVSDGVRPLFDVIALEGEPHEGRPLLVPVMEKGARTPAGRIDLADSRARARRERESLPPALRALEPADVPHRVEPSSGLVALTG
jgi:nicotinate phosphoribosyltransferase